MVGASGVFRHNGNQVVNMSAVLGGCGCGCGPCVCGNAQVQAVHDFSGVPPLPIPMVGSWGYGTGFSQSRADNNWKAMEFWGDLDNGTDGSHGNCTPQFDYKESQRYLKRTYYVESLQQYGTATGPTVRWHSVTETIDRTGLLEILEMSKSDDTATGGYGPLTYYQKTNADGTTTESGDPDIIAKSGIGGIITPDTVDVAISLGIPAWITLDVPDQLSGRYYAFEPATGTVQASNNYSLITVTLESGYSLAELAVDTQFMLDNSVVFTENDFEIHATYDVDWTYGAPVASDLVLRVQQGPGEVGGMTSLREIQNDLGGGIQALIFSNVATHETLEGCTRAFEQVPPVRNTRRDVNNQNGRAAVYTGTTHCLTHIPGCLIEANANSSFFQWGKTQLWSKCGNHAGSPTCCTW